jgi:cell division protein ZipA
MRARDPGPPQELPVVEIEEDSLDPRRVEPGEARPEPPTLSLPVLGSGPVTPRSHTAEPAVSSFDAVKPDRSDEAASAFGKVEGFGESKGLHDRKVPRLDTPAPAFQSAASHTGATQPAGGTKATSPKAKTFVTPDSDEHAFNEAVFGDAGVESDREPDFSDDEALEEGAIADGVGAEGISAEPSDRISAGRRSAEPEPTATPLDITPIKEPIVEWPPDDQRRVVALRLVAPPPERLPGRALRLALASEGFVLGKFQIFHKPDESGRAVLSAANLSKPGTFDLENMDSQRYGGLSLFAVLPGPRPPLKAFEDLLATARNLNERLQGALQDERGGPLTPTRIASLRESLAAETTP